MLCALIYAGLEGNGRAVCPKCMGRGSCSCLVEMTKCPLHYDDYGTTTYDSSIGSHSG